jgi:hypothetical protein
VRSYRTFPPLPAETGGLNFYSTFPKVTLAGRYPAHCPVEPGLSSSISRTLAIVFHTHKILNLDSIPFRHSICQITSVSFSASKPCHSWLYKENHKEIPPFFSLLIFMVFSLFYFLNSYCMFIFSCKAIIFPAIFFAPTTSETTAMVDAPLLATAAILCSLMPPIATKGCTACMAA